MKKMGKNIFLFVLGIILMLNLISSTLVKNDISTSFSNTATLTTSRGVNVTFTADETSIIVTKISTCNATKIWLYNSSVFYLANGTFSGDNATINFSFVNGSSYLIMIDSGGSSYSNQYTLGSIYPVNGTTLNFINGIYFESYGNGSKQVSYLDDGTKSNVLSIWTNNVSSDSLAPTITLNSPVDKYNSSKNYVTPNATVSDNVAVTNVSVFTNISGSWAINQTNSSGINNTEYIFNITGIADGTYLWNVQSCDSSGNCSFAAANRTFTVDTTSPVVNLIYPTNTTYNSIVSAINFTASDLNLFSCWYSNDSGATNSSPSASCLNITGLGTSDGLNHFLVYANDSSGNLGIDDIYFTQDTTDPVVNLISPADYFYSNILLNYFVATQLNSALFNATLHIWNSGGNNIIPDSPCYQESANTTNQTGIDGNCGLKYTGNYIWSDGIGGSNCVRATSGLQIDGNFSTSDVIEWCGLLSNYSIPTGVVNASYRIKIIDGSSGDTTMYCYNYTSSDYSQFHYEADSFDGNISIPLECLSGSKLSVYSYGTNPTVGAPSLYEESIWWYFSSATNNISGTSNQTNQSFTFSSDGNYTWNVEACDVAGNCAMNSSNRTIVIDTTDPVVNLISPSDNYYSNSLTNTFQANRTDINIQNSSLLIWNSSNDLIENNLTNPPNTICYQESANTTNQTGIDGNCGLNYSGNYLTTSGWNTNPGHTVDRVYDGDWNTDCEILSVNPGSIFINYTKPPSSSAIWKIKTYSEFGSGESNITIDSSCFNQDILQLAGIGYISGGTRNFNWTCYNGSSWIVLLSENLGFFGQVYEEAIYWDISNLRYFTFSSDGNYTWNVEACDVAGNCAMNSSNRTIVIDTTSPQISYSTGTPSNDSRIGQNYIFVNTSLTEINFQKISFNLYNSSLVNQTNYSSAITNINWTNLADGIYYFNVTAFDLVNNSNSTSTYQVNLDTANPQIQFIEVTTATGNYSRDYIEANVSATSFFLSTINLTLSNTTGFYQINTSTTSPLSVNYTSLAEGYYYLNATANDTNGRTNKTETRTILLDRTYPNVSIENIYGIGLGSFTLNSTAADTYLSTCSYNVVNSTGDIVIANTTFTCNANTTNSVTAVGNYTLNYFANDSSGNTNSTSGNFTIISVTTIVIGGGGGGGTSIVSVPVVALIKSSLHTQNYTNLTRAIIYGVIYRSCINDSELGECSERPGKFANLTNFLKNTYQVNLTETELILWVNQYDLNEIESFSIDREVAIKNNLIIAEVVRQSPDFYISPVVLDVPKIVISGNVIEQIIESNLVLKSCKVESGDVGFSCSVRNSTALISYVLSNESFSFKKAEARISYTSVDGKNAFQNVTFRIISIMGLAIIGISVAFTGLVIYKRKVIYEFFGGKNKRKK